MKERIRKTLLAHWGYDSFRQFQEEAILSILDARDTLTVLPTGGGKSVCFQLPALLCDGMAVIISPLISLMKDQVDYLKDMGIAARHLNSSQPAAEQRSVIEGIRAGNVKLLYISPERLMFEPLQELLKSVKLSFFVIDEAHCISHWGHNFRAEYRKLGLIKEIFSGVSVHAFTATATEEVQKDIIEQLRLNDPHLYIGNVDRPNLTYRVLPRSASVIHQIVDVIQKHPREPGIIYCLRRADVDEISDKLNALGFKNLPYHAGLSDETRKRNQDDFSAETVDIMVATIAFGMGVDRSNVRYVIHAAMPKSIEHYQQETGRAGRDGLPAACYMFYSGADYKTWEFILKESSPGQYAVMIAKLRALYHFCTRPECRHKYLVSYFGQTYGNVTCGACDYCLGEVDMVDEPLLVGQKILSCVARVKEKFGADHIADVLRGTATEKTGKFGHTELSTFALMSAESKPFIRYMIEQLLGQGFLGRDPEHSTLFITEPGRALLRGEATPVLARPVIAEKKKKIEKLRKAKHAKEWEGVDEGLFLALREKRSELAREKGVPAYIIFSDKTLIDMARVKPGTMERFSEVFGVGDVKRAQYGETFLKVIADYRPQ